VEIRFNRLSEDYLRKQQESLKTSPACEDGSEEKRRFMEWFGALHDTVEMWDDGSYVYYRYDVPCSSGEVLRVDAEMRKVFVAGEALHVDEDDAVIRRIMSSARCLD
jgi:hypothetical protein